MKEAIKGVARGHQWPSVPIRGNQSARAPVATDATAEEMFETGGARKPSGLLASVGMGEHL